MSLLVNLHHNTHYHYDHPIQLGPQIIRLRPAAHCRTNILSYSLHLTPAQHFINWQQDPHGNWLARCIFPEKLTELRIEVDLIADIQVINPFDFFLEPQVESFPFIYEEALRPDLVAYITPEPLGPLGQNFLAQASGVSLATIPFLVHLNTLIHQDIRYVIRLEPGVQEPEETLQKKSGSCRDSAWLLVQLLRHLGLAARFVSGYLIQLKADVKPLEGPSGPEEDFTDLHAWAEVYIPGAGWIGLDPTSGLLCGEGHIPLAATPHYTSAAPLSGYSEPAEVQFHFSMNLKRLQETPRVTQALSEESWTRLMHLGERVDDTLQKNDVRLTVGGEPTFVAQDDFESEEWRVAAVGPTKKIYADRLIRRLQKRFAPQGVLHHGQGKWYPGESLPRWAFSLYWRKDGEPLWHNPDLIVLPSPETSSSSSFLPDDHAENFLHHFADHLGLDPTYVLPAYEDPWYWIHKEGKLPLGDTPLESHLESAEERERLRSVFKRGLQKPVGFVLPLQRWNAQASSPRASKWRSEKWTFRQGHLFLMPGDSPVGFRLPIDGLPWVPPAVYPTVFPQDPFEPRAPLPPPSVFQQAFSFSSTHTPSSQILSEQYLCESAVRTALSVEPREGTLAVFMPPVATLEDYLELLALVEKLATDLKLPVYLEGYPPPPDPRLQIIKVTPDPGVIEVNIHPVSLWDESVEVMMGLYEEARHSGLTADKFLLDGRPTGTGGGHHLVLGGETPGDSPFLRRPDLLSSVILYWQRHPALSYLFSGLFIGPTSQAPRVDEARMDSLYEMEMALTKAQAFSSPPIPPWLVDRLFRHLLVDVTGNTHRAEICIDKLYAPEGVAGRLGLVEFRSFEMAPEPRMALAQSLLLRALIAWFWHSPQTGVPVRWGTSLHDRFMLPHFLWEDFLSILSDLHSAGYPFEADWFRAQYEFRFPLYGHIAPRGVGLEIRQALEPWPVLGEEGGATGTVRYVDSSLDRLQIKATGFIPERHALTCNGYLLPMTATEESQTFIAGVRFKAWSLPSGLHPTLPLDSPLTFDLVDRWTGHSMGGCVYSSSHPGGRSYDLFPINAYEAQARRLARFQPWGHRVGPFYLETSPLSKDFPLTLDLRRTHAC